MRPHVVLLMESSIDGRLHPSRWTRSPDGTRRDWSAAYEAMHDKLAGDAWIVGRVTMGEIIGGEIPGARIGEAEVGARPPTGDVTPARLHVATGHAKPYAVALDPSGKLQFAGPTVAGDHAIVLLGPEVSDAHLAELAANGVSYIVSDGQDLAASLETLTGPFGVRRLLLEGGAGINGSFLAAGLVDEVHVLVAPALDGAPDVQGIVAIDGGLAGRVELSLRAAEVAAHGIVHLHYAVVHD